MPQLRVELNSILEEWVVGCWCHHVIMSSSSRLVQVSGSVLWFLNFIWVDIFSQILTTPLNSDMLLSKAIPAPITSSVDPAATPSHRTTNELL